MNAESLAIAVIVALAGWFFLRSVLRASCGGAPGTCSKCRGKKDG